MGQMNKYQRAKECARDEAIDWQIHESENPTSYDELAEMQERFERLGKRYGLIMEFRENGII